VWQILRVCKVGNLLYFSILMSDPEYDKSNNYERERRHSPFPSSAMAKEIEASHEGRAPTRSNVREARECIYRRANSLAVANSREARAYRRGCGLQTWHV